MPRLELLARCDKRFEALRDQLRKRLDALAADQESAAASQGAASDSQTITR